MMNKANGILLKYALAFFARLPPREGGIGCWTKVFNLRTREDFSILDPIYMKSAKTF